MFLHNISELFYILILSEPRVWTIRSGEVLPVSWMSGVTSQISSVFLEI